LLNSVRNDLEDVQLICKGEKKQTNFHREIIAFLAKGMIPTHWKKYTVPITCTVIQWITDFTDRVKQLQKVSSTSTLSLKNLNVWLGGLFNPEAYITATRQFVAQANGWSLEELMLEVLISDSDKQDVELEDGTFGVIGLKLQGAQTKNNKLYLTSTIFTDLPLTSLRWIHSTTDSKKTNKKVTLPVYLNSTRAELLFSVDLELGENQNDYSFYERGVAFMCSSAMA